jgi:hypothetical protein
VTLVGETFRRNFDASKNQVSRPIISGRWSAIRPALSLKNRTSGFVRSSTSGTGHPFSLSMISTRHGSAAVLKPPPQTTEKATRRRR